MFTYIPSKALNSWQLLACMLVAVFVGGAYADCNVCQANKAACVNSTSFYMCFGGDEPNTEKLYHCKDGLVCTDLNAICVQSSISLTPSCGDTSECGLCSAHANYLFACHSRTTFQWCYGAARPNGQIGECPAGMVCDASSDYVCVPDDGLQPVTCDIVSGDEPNESSSPTVPTSTETTTVPELPDDQPLTANEVCEQKHEVGLFSTIPADPECRRYIYCTYRNGIIFGTEYECAQNTYFQAEMERCALTKPSTCA